MPIRTAISRSARSGHESSAGTSSSNTALQSPRWQSAGPGISMHCRSTGIILPPALTAPPGTDGGMVNLPAMGIVLCLSLLLIRGQKKVRGPMRPSSLSRSGSSSSLSCSASSPSTRRTGRHLCRPPAGSGSSRERRSYFLPLPGLMPWSRPPRRQKIPKRACPSGLSARLPSASSSISCSA